MDELELQTREALDGRPITQNIFPFQARPVGLLSDLNLDLNPHRGPTSIQHHKSCALPCWRHMRGSARLHHSPLSFPNTHPDNSRLWAAAPSASLGLPHARLVWRACRC